MFWTGFWFEAAVLDVCIGALARFPGQWLALGPILLPPLLGNPFSGGITTERGIKGPPFALLYRTTNTIVR